MNLDAMEERDAAEQPDLEPWEHYLRGVARLKERYGVQETPPLHSPSRIDSLTLEEVDEQVLYLENVIRERLGWPPERRPKGTVYELEI